METLEAALWAFHKTRGFRDGALLAANLGDDADTTAAVYGQIAGAYYGAEAIPAEWRQHLAMATEITAMADSLHQHARQPPTQPERSMPAEVTEQTAEIRGVNVRLATVTVAGHTVEQVLSFDIAEAEAVYGRPFDEEMDKHIQMGMFAIDRIAADGTIDKVASATSYLLDGKCVRTAKIEHCNEIKPESASWRITRPDGSQAPRKPWSCVQGAPPRSH